MIVSNFLANKETYTVYANENQHQKLNTNILNDSRNEKNDKGEHINLISESYSNHNPELSSSQLLVHLI